VFAALDMQSLGLSHEDLNPSGPLSSRRALARAQSAQIMTKKFIQRDRIKEQMKKEEVHMLCVCEPCLCPLSDIVFQCETKTKTNRPC
jgi:hypothetical protein